MSRAAWAQWTGTSSGLVVPEAKALLTVEHNEPITRLSSKSEAPNWTDERGREWKVSAGSATVSTDDDTHTCITIASITGILDRVDDVILPGAYARTLQVRTPKAIDAHDWAKPTGKCLQIAELMPGDQKLPATLPDGSPWPREAGALVAKVLFNVASPDGAKAWANVDFYGPDQEWSIGYNAKTAKRGQDGIRRIAEMDLYEISTVLWGAMPWARTVGVGGTA